MTRLKLDALATPLPNGIREIRERRKLTPAKAAECLGMPLGSYSPIENGNFLASQYWLEKICATFKCKPEDVYPQQSLLAIIYRHRLVIEDALAILNAPVSEDSEEDDPDFTN